MRNDIMIDGFSLCPLDIKDISVAKKLCDECVGKDLYDEEEIKKSIDDANIFFYLLKQQNGETIGYIYFYITDEVQIASDGKMPASKIRSVCTEKKIPVGKIQSVGVKEQYRKCGLGAKMIGIALERFKECGVRRVFIICWKKGDAVPLAQSLMQYRFDFLALAEMVWFDHPRLYFPYCKGRCRCDAEVYYKILD